MKKRFGIFSRKTETPSGLYDFSDTRAREQTIEDLLENCAIAKRKNEVYWKKMRRYYDGEHDISYVQNSFCENMDLPFEPAKSTDGFAHVESQIDTELPDFEFAPAGELSYECAKAREETVRRICDVNDVRDKNILAERMLGIYGSAVWKVYWGENPKSSLYDSEVIVSMPELTEIYTDPTSNTIDGCEYIAYVYPMHKQKARRIFEEDLAKRNENFEDYIGNYSYKRVVYEGDYEDNDTVTITEFWFKQPKNSGNDAEVLYSAGDIALCVLINGKEIRYIPKYWLNTSCNMFPFIIYNKIPNIGNLWGKSELEPLIPLIDAADRELTFAQLNSAFCANDVILAEENAFSEGETPDNSPGAVWKLRPGMMGKVQRLGNMSYSQSGLFSNYSIWQSMMEQTSGNYDINQGKEPTRVTTASGIALMNERAKSRIALKKAGRTEGFKRLFKLIDMTALEFYENGRKIEHGKNKDEFEREKFILNKKDGKYIPSPDIKIHVGDGISNSKAFTVSAINSLMGTEINSDNYKFIKAYVDLIGLPMRNEICAFLDEKFASDTLKEPEGEEKLWI